MARTGNHGVVIPRDKGLLHSLYWEQQMTLPEIGRLYGVTHKSVERAMRELGIPRRHVGTPPDRLCKFPGCTKRPIKIRHAGNGSLYGTLCAKHRKQHYAGLARAASKRPEVKARVRKQNQRAYYCGPLIIKGEQQWLSKSRAMLRSAQRLCRTGALPKV